MAGSDREGGLADEGSAESSAEPRSRHDFALAPAGFAHRFSFALDHLLLTFGASLERELEAARGLPWLAVAFCGGSLLYFLLPAEPAAPAPVLLAAILAIAAWRTRHGAVGLHRFLLLAALVAGGCGLAKLRTDYLATPMIERAATLTVKGFVAAREARRGGYRLTLDVVAIDGARLASKPARVMVMLRSRTAPLVGDGVSMLARLQPPSGPMLPGGYDFGLRSFYLGIGATGFAYGRASAADLGPPPLAIRLSMPLEALREAIRGRIASAIGEGDAGRVATSLIIGDPGGLSQEAEDDMRQSGLAHVLSVSGLHMVLVAGATFWIIRALLALLPGLALRCPIKKWAAAAALAITFFYLLISGLDVAAQRSFVMTGIVFTAIIVERQAISMRNVAISAFIVLALAPESVLDAGCQMSFAATIALVAGAETLAARRRKRGPRMLASRWPWLLRPIGWLLALVVGLAVTAFLGGIGTTPFALYHFQRMAPLSIIANVLAMPLIDFFVMPLALGAVIAMPFGLDQPLLTLMGLGIDGMLAVAAAVTRWSEGTGGAAMPSGASILVFIAGFLWLALMGERWRLAGLGPMAIGIMLAFTPSRPDLLVSPDGSMLAIRDAAGHYQVLARRIARFEADIWLRSDGDPRKAAELDTADGGVCDALGCIGRLADGRSIALSLDRGAFAEDCRRAALVVTPLDAPAGCQALTAVIDRAMIRTHGALALRLLAPKRADSPVTEASSSERPSDRPEADDDPVPAEPEEGAPPLAMPVIARVEPDRLAALAIVSASYPPLRRAFMPPLRPLPD